MATYLIYAKINSTQTRVTEIGDFQVSKLALLEKSNSKYGKDDSCPVCFSCSNHLPGQTVLRRGETPE